MSEQNHHATNVAKAIEAMIDVKLRSHDRQQPDAQGAAVDEQEMRAIQISLSTALEKLITGWVKLGRRD